MKAVVVEKYGDPDVLTLVDIPAPHAGRGEVRIRMYAAAVNRPTGCSASVTSTRR